jgi:hypothetical protein
MPSLCKFKLRLRLPRAHNQFSRCPSSIEEKKDSLRSPSAMWTNASGWLIASPATITQPVPSAHQSGCGWSKKKRISRRAAYLYIKQENRSTTVYATRRSWATSTGRLFAGWSKITGDAGRGGRWWRRQRTMMSHPASTWGCGGRSLSCALVLPHRRNATKPARRRGGTCRAGCLHPRAVGLEVLVLSAGPGCWFWAFLHGMAWHSCFDRLGTGDPQPARRGSDHMQTAVAWPEHAEQSAEAPLGFRSSELIMLINSYKLQ